MDVSSVSSSSNAALTASIQAQSRTRPAEQDPSTRLLQQAQQAQGSPQAQGTAPVDQSAATIRSEVEGSRPTVNINGQTVGTRVNTTA